MAFTLLVNGAQSTVGLESDTPLLWVVRDSIGPTDTTIHRAAALRSERIFEDLRL